MSDYPTLKFPEGLFGRSSELSALAAAAQHGPGAAVLLQGLPGVGKTALLEALRKEINSSEGWCARGSFADQPLPVPYAGLAGVLADLAHQILAEPPPRLRLIRQRLQAALHTHGALLNGLAPSFAYILGEYTPLPAGAVDQPARLVAALRLLFNTLADIERPLVICLDDFQWADTGSLEIVRRLLLESPPPDLLAVLAVRTETEVNLAAQLTLAELQRQRPEIASLYLAPLDAPTVARILAAALTGAEPVDVDRTAAILFGVTQGNPLLLRQAMYAADIATQWQCDTRCGQWVWRPAVVADERSSRLAGMLSLRLRHVSAETHELLAVAACTGYDVEPAFLGALLDLSASCVAVAMQQSVAAGLLVEAVDAGTVPSNDGDLPHTYRFVHGEVQRALLDTLAADQRAAIHRQIGDYLLRTVAPGQRHAAVFTIVRHLGAALHPQHDKAQAVEMAELFVEAARAALAIAAIHTAHTYAQNALDWAAQAPDGWRSQYDLLLAVHELAVRTALYCGDYPRLEQFSRLVLLQAQTAVDKAGVFKSLITAATMQGQYEHAIDLLREALAGLGVRLPLRPTRLSILAAWWRTRLVLRRFPATNMQLAQTTSSRSWWEVGDLILNTYTAMQWSGQHMLIGHVALLGVRIAQQHGHTPLSVLAFTIYSMLLSTQFGDVNGGRRMAQVATDLSHTPAVEPHDASTVVFLNALVLHQTQPVRTTLEPLRRAWDLAMAGGDVRLATDCTIIYLNHLYVAGTPLADAIAQGAALIAQLEPYGETVTLLLCRMLHQTLCDLASPLDLKQKLNADAQGVGDRLAQLHKSRNLFGLAAVYNMRALLYLLFGRTHAALQAADQARRYAEGTGLGLFLEAVHCQVDALARLAWLQTAPITEHRQQIHLVQQDIRQLRRWAASSPANHLHRLRQVEGGLAYLQGRVSEAEQALAEAWSLAAANGFSCDEALCAEMAAHHCLDLEQFERAAEWRQRAAAAYTRWGAWANLHYMAQTEPFWLQAPPAPSLAAHLAEPDRDGRGEYSRNDEHHDGFVQVVDFAVLHQELDRFADEREAVQYLLSQLLERLHASRVAFLLVRGEQIILYADQSCSQLEAALPALLIRDDASAGVPLGLIRLAIRQQATVDLSAAEAAAQGLLAADPADSADPAADPARHLLCAPLVVQGQIAAVLHVERGPREAAQEDPRFADHETAYAATLAAHTTLLVENSQLRQRLTGAAVAGSEGADRAHLSAWLLGTMRIMHHHRDITPLLQGRLRDLVAFLLLEPHDQPVPRARIAAQLWPDTSESQALTNVRNLLHKLRSVGPELDEVLQIGRQSVQWQAGISLWVDARACALGLAEAGRLSGAAAIHQLRQSVALYTGDLLPDCADEWVYPMRERLHDLYLGALSRLVDLLIEQYDFAEALRYAQLLVNAAPLSEEAYGHLIRAHALAGNSAAARQAYNACAAMLAAEFETTPSPATQAVYQRYVATVSAN